MPRNVAPWLDVVDRPMSNRERIAEAIGTIQDVAGDIAIGPTAFGYLTDARVALENAAQHKLSADEG